MEGRRPWYRRHAVWLLFLTALAAVIRLPTIGFESVWMDEAISYLAASLPIPQILDNTVQSSHPPLYYLLLHFWQQAAPDSDAALRLLSVLWGVLLVPAVYLTARPLLGRRPALWAAALVALSPFHLLYSHELRMYTQLMFLATAGVGAYWQARQTMRYRWWLLAGFLLLLAVYTHLFALFVLAALGLHALLRYRRDSDAFWRTVLLIGAIALLFTPWAVTLLAEQQKDLGSLRPFGHSPGRSPIKPLTELTALSFGRAFGLLYTGAALYMALIMTVLLLFDLRRAREESAPPGLDLVLLLALCTLGFPLLLYYVRPYFLPSRALAATSPFLLMLWAWGVERPKRAAALAPLGVTLAVMLWGNALYWQRGPIKSPFRDAVNFVAEHYREGDAVLHTGDGSYLPALRYTALSQHGLLAGDPQPRKPEAVYRAVGGELWARADVEEKGQRLWLIVALDHSQTWQEEQFAYFAERYRQLARHEFKGIDVFLFQLTPAGAP